MLPIRIKFDPRYQQVKLEEYADDYLFEDGEDYYLFAEDPSIDLGVEDLDLGTDDFDDISLIEE